MSRTSTLAALLVALVLVLGVVRVEATDPNINYQTWNEYTATSYCMYAYAAYCPRDNLNKWNCHWCKQNEDIKTFTPVSFVQDTSTNTFGYIGYNTYLEQILVVFRGTEPLSLKNWITDLEFAKMTPYANSSCPNAKVHEGFFKAWSNVKSQVQEPLTLLAQQYPTYPIIVSGHSLGAALATLATMDIITYVPPSRVFNWNFGNPRVGDQNFVYCYTNATVNQEFRVVNNRDVVPHLPPYDFGFRHEPTEIWHHDGNYTICNSSGEDPSCSDSLTLPTSIEDHLHYMDMQLLGCFFDI